MDFQELHKSFFFFCILMVLNMMLGLGFSCVFELRCYSQHMRLSDCRKGYLTDMFPLKIYIGTFATIWTKMAFQELNKTFFLHFDGI